MKKGIKKTNADDQKLDPILTRANNQKLEFVGKDKRKKEEIMKKQKIKIMAAKNQRV